MLVAQRVNDFITGRAPQALCDKCICEAMTFNSQAHAGPAPSSEGARHLPELFRAPPTGECAGLFDSDGHTDFRDFRAEGRGKRRGAPNTKQVKLSDFGLTSAPP